MAQPASVLIIAEVEDADRVALEAACSVAGFFPTVEPSAEVATGKLGQKRFDVLIVHMGTPGAALACMRARGKLLRIRIPVLALADTENDAAFARAYRAGADEVLLFGRSEQLTQRLTALPKPSIPQPGNARGDAVVADADRTRAEVLERVLRDAGFRVDVVVDGFAARLQAGRPSLKVAVVDASLDDVPPLIVQARSKGARCAWVVRARPEHLDELRQKLAPLDRVAVVSAYGPPEDVLFEANRMIEPRQNDGRSDARVLHGTIVKLRWAKDAVPNIGYTYNVSPLGLFVRTVVPPLAETLEIEVAPPGQDKTVRLEGNVVWKREFGTTRKEPVPAGFGVRITGGDVQAWAEACPEAPSLRHSMSEEIRPLDLKLDSIPSPRRDSTDPPRGIVPPGDIDIHPREPLSSVEEMLASVLNETISGDESGAAPLSIAGDSVVELKDGEEVAPAARSAPPPPIATPSNKPPPRVPSVAPRASELASVVPSAEALEITAASLGFMDMLDADAAAALEAEREVQPPAKPEESFGTSDTIPAPSLASEQIEARARAGTSARAIADAEADARAAAKARAEEQTSPRAHVPLRSTLPPRGDGPRDSELRLPTRGGSSLAWFAAAAVIVGGAAFFALPRASSKRTPVQPAVVKPSVQTSSAEPSTPAEPSASAAPSVPAEPSAPAIPAIPAIPAMPSAVGIEGEEAALAALSKGQGLLYVASPLTTNVYVYGLFAGVTNQRITTNCGPRFLRLGTKPGAWQTEGVVAIVKCRASTRVEMAP